MKKLTQYAKRIGAVLDALNEIATDFENQCHEIEDEAVAHERELSGKEFDCWDDMNTEFNAICDCMESLEDALRAITDYYEV